MADETLRPRRPNQEQPQAFVPPSVTGTIPPQFMAALQAAQLEQEQEEQEQPIQNLSGAEPKKGFGSMGQPQMPSPQALPSNNPMPQQEEFKPTLPSGNLGNHLKELLENLKESTTVYEEVELPSRGKFYDGKNGPVNGIVSIRAMTGEEEQILATPRFVKKGQAINMIFQRCIKEKYRPENLLTVDRTFLLIYLRGISYSPNYDVELKCPECEKKFNHTINLDTLYVESAPDEYGPDLRDVLPTTKLPFSYRLSTGKDEQEIADHRDRRLKAFGDGAADDTLLHRTAMLVNDIDGLTNKNDIQILLKNLPISDVSYIRNCVNEPPFGVDTSVEIICANCLQDFEVDLPMEAGFFFPRRKKSKNQA